MDSIPLYQDGTYLNLDMIDGINDAKYEFPEIAGKDVDIYILDTGILADHEVFQGRAKMVANFAQPETSTKPDDFDHGTHVAGIAAMVARKANILGVRVLGMILVYGCSKLRASLTEFSADGGGSGSWMVQGIEYVIEQAAKSGRRSVINYSIGADGSDPTIAAAMRKATAAGITVVVAAGNLRREACGTSPSEEASVISVGNSTPERKQYEDPKKGSNFGACVDIFAPGVNIYSALSSGVGDYGKMTGTSMASPYVAGIAAILLSVGVPPANILNQLLRITNMYVSPTKPDIRAHKYASMQHIQSVQIPKK
ncbi:peptidase S8/S53 domain-containing protein [Paraphysoderma sedebokerense]|nr:peptidase S8/S53 domain-containing protein [Paraphysoderma sedebokerense]